MAPKDSTLLNDVKQIINTDGKLVKKKKHEENQIDDLSDDCGGKSSAKKSKNLNNKDDDSSSYDEPSVIVGNEYGCLSSEPEDTDYVISSDEHLRSL